MVIYGLRTPDVDAWVLRDDTWVSFATGNTREHNPEPPATPTMLIGGALSNDPSYIDGYNADCGPIRCMREYDNGLSATFASYTPWAAYNQTNQMATAFSFKLDHANMAAGQYDTRIETFVDSWPDGHPGYLIIDNEPDQNSKGLNPATFRAAVEHVHALIGAEPKPGVTLGIALMQYTFRPALNSPTAGSQWLPDVDQLDVDIHCYGNTWRSPLETMLSLFLPQINQRGWTWGIGETNCQEDPNNASAKADWFTNCADYAAANGAKYWLPFDTGVGGSAAVRTSPQATAAVKAIAEKYDAGPQGG